MAALREPVQVDLSMFSAAECARIWEVLQKDFRLRFLENQRLQRLKTQLVLAGEKALLLGKDPNFNDSYCIVCFRFFIIIFNPKAECCGCLCNACRSCARYLSDRDKWLCRLCEEERIFAAKQCSWFYNGNSKRFVVSGNHSSIPSGSISSETPGDPITEQMRKYLQGFVARYKQEEEPGVSEEDLQPHRARGVHASRQSLLDGPALKKITAHQVMRFQTRIGSLSSDFETFLRANCPELIPNPGEKPQYDQKMESYRQAIANVLRNFSQTLYIAIEGHRSKTGQPVCDIHTGVHQILQDEVESLVGHRVDLAFAEVLKQQWPADDDAVSTTSEDVGGNFGEYGPTIHDRLTEILMDKWLSDHQSILDDQQMSASENYPEVNLERVLARKAASKMNFGELPIGMQPELDSASARESSSSEHSGSNWLLRGRPSANCAPTLWALGDRRDSGARVALDERVEMEAEEEEEEGNLSLSLSSIPSLLDPRERKTSTASLDFDAVYRQNCERLQSQVQPEKASARSEVTCRSLSAQDSGVQVTFAPPEPKPPSELEKKFSLGFSKMDWSLSEQSDPRFVAKTAEVTAEEGDCAVIGVEVAGTEPIDIFWHRCTLDELRQLEEGPRVEFATAPDHPRKHCLLLWHLRPDDEGDFLAIAVNQNGSCQLGFRVSVTARSQAVQPPEFCREIADEAVRRGDSARLNCRVLGSPLPRVTFEREGRRLRESDKISIMRIGDRSFSLVIHDVEPEDEATYSCVATNCAGTAHCSASIQISKEGYRLTRRYLFLPSAQPGVDSSPTVKVRDQVSLISREQSQAANLFRDRIEPLVREKIDRTQLANRKEGRRRREPEPPAPPKEKKQTKKEKEEEFRPDIDISEFELRIENFERQTMDCGLKRVGSEHRKNFHVKRKEAASEKDKETTAKEDASRRVQKESQKSTASSTASSSVRTAEVSYSSLSTRRGQADVTDSVSDIRTLIESGKIKPQFAPNMFASFRTRKFPSVNEIRRTFSGRAVRGSYTKRAPTETRVWSPPGAKVSQPSEDFRAVKLKTTGRELQD